MAQQAKRLTSNVAGDFYVDETCIDCATCRWMAPETFAASGEYSAVHTQPQSEAAIERALRALVACPTASIGTVAKHAVKPISQSFPLPIHEVVPGSDPAADDGRVFHCGYHHEDSFGAASYLIRREEGNILVDSPRFAAPLVTRIHELGGIQWLFLTHKDDVADHEQWAKEFRCQRIMHAGDIGRSLHGIDYQVEGTNPIPLTTDLMFIPTPGHTRGSMCLLFDDTYLFTGDHLSWSPARQMPYASRATSWFNWEQQKESVKRLLDYDFSWILPGHGWPVQMGTREMETKMRELVANLTPGPSPR